MSVCGACGFEGAEEGRACPLCGADLASQDDAVTLNLPTDASPAPAHRRERHLHAGDVYAGRYAVESVLGEGGMGTVYRVRDSVAGRVVALKVLHPTDSGPEGFERFKREVGILAKITHPSVPRVFDWGIQESELYFTGELVEGTDLKAEIKKRAAWPPREAAELAAAVADALAVAHEMGVIHRDVKPHNIMVGSDGSVKLLDFGIARSIGLGMKTITKSDVVVGTPEYMSPEQLVSHRVDERSDIYSLGVVLFELVTGRVPFTGDTPIGIALKQRTEPPPLPRSLRPEIPAWLERTVLKCLEKEKSKRFLSARELAAELRRPRREGRQKRRSLKHGDSVLEDDSESSDWALVLESPREKLGWSVGMALQLEGRFFKLEELVPGMVRSASWVYRFRLLRDDEVIRGVVDYEQDADERARNDESSVGAKLKKWLSK